jgi:hypothetical protein
MDIYPSGAIRPIRKSGIHDINAILDYGFDYSLWLETGESISTSAWFVDALTPGVTLGSGSYADSHNGTITKVWVIAVDSDIERFILTNRVTTTFDSRQDDFSMMIYTGYK